MGLVDGSDWMLFLPFLPLPFWIPAFAGMTSAGAVGFRHFRSRVTSFSYQCHASDRGLYPAFVSEPPLIVQPRFKLQVDLLGKNAGQLEADSLLAMPRPHR